eukprot:8126877-Pyramimonas_sp.AAC.1
MQELARWAHANAAAEAFGGATFGATSCARGVCRRLCGGRMRAQPLGSSSGILVEPRSVRE